MLTSSHILPPYDLQTYLLSENVSDFTAPFASWDGVQFISVAMNGYLHEHQHAFFPFFPTIISTIVEFIKLIIDVNDADIYIVIGVMISFISFMVSMFTLYYLTKDLFNESFAFKTALIFNFSPANVFFVSVYTESLYACFSLLACYFLLNKKRVLFACAFFLLTSFVRSNGIINTGFVLYYFVDTITPFCTFPRLVKPLSLRHCVNTYLLFLANLFPFVLYIYISTTPYCDITPKPPYCNSFFPNVYSYIQSRYWNQGFLKYWRIHQIPNFLLCSPAVIITLIVCGCYMFNYFKRHPLFMKPFQHSSQQKVTKFLYNNDILVYVVHLLALVIFGVFFMHTQVITRFISACPAFYWGIIWLTQQRILSWFRYLPIFYCVFYTCFGAVMFSSFYPWT
ncbi:GPI mannosyltransferase 2 [Entamoeba marina]